jgi:hypothetical protein
MVWLDYSSRPAFQVRRFLKMISLQQCRLRCTLVILGVLWHPAESAQTAASPAPRSTPATFPTQDSTLRRIWRLEMDSSLVEQLAQPLIDSIGPVLMGRRA